MRLPDGRYRKRRVALNIPGQAHELTFSCYRRLPLLARDRTRQWFLEALEAARVRWCFAIWAYVLMPEHTHVIVFPRGQTYAMAAILKAIKQPVSQRAMAWLRGHGSAFLRELEIRNGAGKVVEHRFWQAGGGYDRNVIEPATAWTQIEYLHNNPVRRGLVRRAVDWPHSSARFYAGLDGVMLTPDRPEM